MYIIIYTSIKGDTVTPSERGSYGRVNKFKKCKENIEMLNTTNQVFKEKYLLALNNIEENFSNYS